MLLFLFLEAEAMLETTASKAVIMLSHKKEADLVENYSGKPSAKQSGSREESQLEWKPFELLCVQVIMPTGPAWPVKEVKTLGRKASILLW